MAMDEGISKWTETDLTALIGQSESSRVEFKSGKLFDQDRDKYVETLSIEVSAFANSEGGILVLGMAEGKEGKSPVATHLDGIDREKVPIQQLQQLVEGNVSPYLPGIRFRSIPLSGPPLGRVCVVVSVPQGATAYQAKDRRYYGRSEYHVQPLPDHEIRLRMQRGRTAKAIVELCQDFDFYDLSFDEEDDHKPPPTEQELREMIDTPGIPWEAIGNGWRFLLQIRNIGDVTIRSFSLEVTCDRPDTIDLHRNNYALGVSVAKLFRSKSRGDEKIFPGECLRFRDPLWTLSGPGLENLKPGSVILHWSLFLDDAPPTSGSFDLVQLMNAESRIRQKNRRGTRKRTSVTAPKRQTK